MTAVVLTGFMGTGKTSVGRKLAERLACPFVDTDAIVERREGRPIAAIFATGGEPHFRNLERDAIEEALLVPGAVIATGGGAIVNAGNFAALRAAAPIVCLTARPEVIDARTRCEGNRPLLDGEEPLGRIERLLQERAPAYAKADLTIDTSDRPIDDVVDEIVGFLERATGAENRGSG